MKKRVLILIVSVLFIGCNSRYIAVPGSKVTSERKQIAENFLKTYFKKCQEKDYTAMSGFKLSKRFEGILGGDSLRKKCEIWDKSEGKIVVGKYISAHTAKSPKDFLDVFNFEITSENNPGKRYIHLGMYRDQNYLELPFYTSIDESYYETIRKKYYKK